MIPTRASVVILGLGLAGWCAVLLASLPALGLSAEEGARLRRLGFWAVLALDGAVLLLAATDAFLALRRLRGGALSLRRERPACLSLGVENEIVLVLENRLGSRLEVVARDAPPEGFPATPEELRVSLPPHGQGRAGYRLLPTSRGRFSFEDVAVRCRGPLGLAWVDRVVPAAEAVEVYPNLLQVRRYETLVRTTLARAGGYAPRRRPGAGRELSHYRDYTPDDDYRHISWKLTARRHRPTTSVFESEHSQDIIFCLDVGRMMAARVGALSKLDHAINAILMLAHVSQTFQDNLGLLVFSHTVHQYIPPGKGQGQHARFLQALYTVQPRLCHVSYREAFSYLIARHPKRALTLVFTDLLDEVVSREYVEAAALLRRFHLPLTLAIADVPLRELAAATPENAGQLYDTLVARQLLQGRSELLRGLERQGVPVVDTVPERLTVDAVNRYLSLKTGVRT